MVPAHGRLRRCTLPATAMFSCPTYSGWLCSEGYSCPGLEAAAVQGDHRRQIALHRDRLCLLTPACFPDRLEVSCPTPKPAGTRSCLPLTSDRLTLVVLVQTKPFTDHKADRV